MLRRVAIYGVLLALGAAVLSWIEYQRLARVHAGDLYLGLVALAFLVLGVVMGARMFGAAQRDKAGNPAAQQSLGISARELEVLQLLAAGKSNKEIAAALNVSPNTVKTHVARLYEKLGAKRRTDAVRRAQELGMLS